MAGTSGDGIDAACVRIEGHGESMQVRFLSHFGRPFGRALRKRLLAAMAPATTSTEELARLHADLGDAFAEAARTAIDAMDRSERPVLIGLAGQTVCHLPGARGHRTVTLQLGDPSRVAATTGLPTVADFRQGDVAVGGQGAPLVPWTDWVLFKQPRIGRAVQNIGGIGNVTWLPPGGKAGDVIAFDTGPGNMIIDALVARATDGRERMDRNGRRAARGRVLPEVLSVWMKHSFLKRKPPKTTGREAFGDPFIDEHWPRLQRASRCCDDWIATATAFTACSIADAYRRFLPRRESSGGTKRRGPSTGVPRGLQCSGIVDELIVCGGGARNATLLLMLSARLPGLVIRPIDSLGIPTSAKEAVSFAMLAAARMDGVPANLPRVTGAARPAVLGGMFHP